VQVVPRSMAVLHYLNGREEPIAAEHAHMTKFRSQQDDKFQYIRQRIQDMALDGLDAVRARVKVRKHRLVSARFELHSTAGVSLLEVNLISWI
jgi:predicted AlkP superfamily pyrophosphatase or phosphodiesterase